MGKSKPKPISKLGSLGQALYEGLGKADKAVKYVANNYTPIGVVKSVRGFIKDNKDAQKSIRGWGEMQDKMITQKIMKIPNKRMMIKSTKTIKK